MRALRAALAAIMFLAPAVEARGLLMFEFLNEIPTAELNLTNNRRQQRLVRSVMDRFGVDYVEPHIRGSRAGFAASGVQTWVHGTAGANNEQLDWVVVGQFTGTNAYRQANTFRGDSLTLTRTNYVPQVPQLFLLSNAPAVMEATDPIAAFDPAAGCSIGVYEQFVSITEGIGGYLVGSPFSFLNHGNVARYRLFGSTDGAAIGGVRSLMGGGVTAYGVRSRNQNVPCSWCDSLGFAASPDTVIMWERLWSNRSDASPQVYASVSGNYVPAWGDSTHTALGLGVESGPSSPETSPFMILAGLARLDSITGGAVFDGSKLPVRVALTIDGGFAHNARRHPVGFLVSDSTALKETIDSLAALNIPAVLGVNLDSVANYPNEKGWWDNWTKLRYTPQMWNGVSDTTADGGVPSFLHPVDVWGRYRNRAALGDTTTHEGADSTIYKLLRGALYKTDSIFGANSVSRFALAPDDDWSPKNLHGSRASPPMDSVFLAARLAGFKGVRINVQSRDGDPGYLTANPKGYVREQGRYVDSRKQPFTLLGHSGHPIAGAVRQISFFQDSVTTPGDSSSYPHITTGIYRAWVQITQLEDQDRDAMPPDYSGSSPSASFGPHPWTDVDVPSHDKLYPVRRGAILRFCVNDFSGVPNGPPARVGWHIVKTLANQFAAINRLAGKTVIEFAYPEDIAP